MTAKIISFINMKGGVGKTTLCIGMGHYLATELNKKILFIDIDPQFNSTQSLLGEFDQVDLYLDELRNTKTIRSIFKQSTDVYEEIPLPEKEEVIHQFNENIHMILGNINLIFDNSTSDNSRIKRIRKFVNHHNLRDEYDFIFIDCPPTISFYTDAALMASDYYIIPNRIDRYSTLGVTSLLSVTKRIISEEDLNLRPLGIIYTMLDETLTQKTAKIKDDFETEVKDNNLYIFKNNTTIVRDLMVGNSGNIASNYSKSKKDIKNICVEFLGRIDEENGTE